MIVILHCQIITEAVGGKDLSWGVLGSWVAGDQSEIASCCESAAVEEGCGGVQVYDRHIRVRLFVLLALSRQSRYIGDVNQHDMISMHSLQLSKCA